MNSKKKWVVYILVCADGTLYTGVTTDPKRRLEQHNSGIASKYTRARRPVEMIHQEPGHSRSTALSREAAIKKMPRFGKLRLIGRKDAESDKACKLPR